MSFIQKRSPRFQNPLATPDTTPPPQAVFDEDGWADSQLNVVRATVSAVALVLTVTAFGYADELPVQTVLPDDDSLVVTVPQAYPVKPNTQVWAVGDDEWSPVIEEDYQHPLSSLRVAPVLPTPWVDPDEVPVVTTFEEDAQLFQYPQAPTNQRNAWFDQDELTPTTTVVLDEDYWQQPYAVKACVVQPVTWTDDDFITAALAEEVYHSEFQRPRTTIPSVSTADDDIVPLVATFVEEDYWDTLRVQSRTVSVLPLWGDVDEVPVIVVTDVDFTPLLDQKISRFVDTTLWTQPDEWPTPPPPTCVPTETESTSLLFDKIQLPPDTRLWGLPDEVPNANTQDEDFWAPPFVIVRPPYLWLPVEQDDLPIVVVIALDEAQWLPEARISRPVLQTFDVQDERPVIVPLHEVEETPLLYSRIERPNLARVFDFPDEHPTITVVVPTETEYTPLMMERVHRFSYARVWQVDDETGALRSSVIRGNASFHPTIAGNASFHPAIAGNASFHPKIFGTGSSESEP